MSPHLEWPRPARLHERDAILDLTNYIFRTSHGREPTVATDYPHVYDPDNLENVFVVADEGRLVASTALWPNEVRIGDIVLRVGGINLVGTLPDYRRLGLGERLMQAAQARMADLGCHIGLLSTDIANWYRRFGWERAGVTHTYRFDRVSIDLLPPLSDTVSWRVAGDEAVSDLCNLRNADGLGAMRAPALLRTFLARRPTRIVVAERDGKPSAYVLVRDEQIIDWAGNAEDIAGLIRVSYGLLDDPPVSTSERSPEGQALGSRQLPVTTPAGGHPLIDLFTQMRVPVNVDYLGMIYLVAPDEILRAFGHEDIQIHSQVHGEQETFTLTVGEESTTLTRSQLTKLFFGPECVSRFGEEVFPFPFWQWRLERV